VATQTEACEEIEEMVPRKKVDEAMQHMLDQVRQKFQELREEIVDLQRMLREEKAVNDKFKAPVEDDSECPEFTAAQLRRVIEEAVAQVHAVVEWPVPRAAWNEIVDELREGM
jgi:Skp family chaperone for outer membrane proteins